MWFLIDCYDGAEAIKKNAKHVIKEKKEDDKLYPSAYSCEIILS